MAAYTNVIVVGDGNVYHSKLDCNANAKRLSVRVDRYLWIKTKNSELIMTTLAANFILLLQLNDITL